MTSDRSLFETYDKWSGGAAQVGDGDKLRAVGRGRLKPIIVRNYSTGTPVTLRVQQYAWHVPTLVFDILSIPMLQKDRIQVNLGAFNERTAPMNYLRDYTTGAVVKLSLMNGIFVMKPVNAAQVPASLRGEIEAMTAPAQTKGVAEGIMPAPRTLARTTTRRSCALILGYLPRKHATYMWMCISSESIS